MAIFVVSIGIVLSEVHRSPIDSFIPFFAVSLLFWNFFSSTLTESMESLIGGGSLIKDRAISPLVPILQTIMRNMLIAAHCIIVPVVVLFSFGAGSVWGLMIAIPGILLFMTSVASIAICVAALGTRFRDAKRIIESFLLVAFLSTPILWQPGALRESSSYVILLNPLAHLFSAWREPLLNGTIPWSSLSISLLISTIACICALVAIRQMRRAAFWI